MSEKLIKGGEARAEAARRNALDYDFKAFGANDALTGGSQQTLRIGTALWTKDAREKKRVL